MITEIHKENLRMEQSLRAERVAAGLDLDGYWMLTRAILGDYNCDEESVTRAISNNNLGGVRVLTASPTGKVIYVKAYKCP